MSRFEKHMFEATIRDMARELVTFQEWLTREVMDKAKNPDTAQRILLDAFQDLEKEIKRAIKAK